MINIRDTKVSYKGDGQTTVFPFSFPFLKKEYIHVAIYDELTGETTILESDYYVDAVAHTVNYPGWPSGQEPAEALRPPVLPETSTITIYRQTDIDQLTNLGNKYPLPDIEDMADKLTHICQEMEESVGRAIKAPIGSPETPEGMYLELIEDAEAAKQAAAETATNLASVKAYYRDTEAAKDAAQTAADTAAASAGSAQTAATRAQSLAGEAASQAAAVGVLATRAEDILAGHAAYTVPPWDANTVYSYPDVVAYTNGNTYRCIGQNLPAGTTPDSSKYWVRITTRGGDDFFDIDVWGGLMPSENPTAAYNWTLDANGDIMPRDASDNVGREPRTVAEEALEEAEAALATVEELVEALPMELDDDGNATTTEPPAEEDESDPSEPADTPGEQEGE